MRLLLLLTAILLVPLVVMGQLRQGSEIPAKKFRVFMEHTTIGSQGYDWGYVGALGAEITAKQTTTTIQSSLDTANKSFMKDGTTFRVNGNSYWNFTKHFFVGGGGTWGKLMTSEWSKQSFHPYVGGGWGYADGRLTLDWRFAGTDKSNGVRGWQIESLVPLGNPDFCMVHRFARYSVYETDCPTCKRDYVRTGSMGFLFRF